VKKVVEFIEVPRQDIKTSRKFRRGASHGMKVWRSMTINFDLIQMIEHVVMECPNYKLTNCGPVYDRKGKEETENES
jgi:hypothetical protein